MKTQSSKYLTGFVALTTGAALCAQEKPAPTTSPPPAEPPAKPSAGVFNDWARRQSESLKAWDVGGQFRARAEFKHNYAVPGTPGAVDFADNGPDSQNNYVLLRTKFHVGYTPCEWFTIFGEGRNSSSTGDKRNPNPESDGPVDLQQGYVRVGFGDEYRVFAKIGRQELAYGDERLVGTFDWSNIGRVFDAAKLTFDCEQGWIDVFGSRTVIADDNNFNVDNDYEWFSGVYASTRTLVPKQETQLYLLARNVGAESPQALGTFTPPNPLIGASPRDIYTLGLRVKSLPGEWHGWDYEAEVAGQLGNYQYPAATPGVVNGQRLDHEAFAAHAAGGYTFTKAWGEPRVGLEYNFASGDSDPTDDTHGTFDNLYPTNHRYYGHMDFFSWQNVHNARLSTSLKPSKDVRLTADYHAFWLADTSDFFYQANGGARTSGGYGINPGAGSFAGQEVDVIATFSMKPGGALQAGYGHFFVGDYVRDSLAASGSDDADWVYVQVLLNF